MVKNPPANAGHAGRSPGETATRSSVLAWEIPWAEETGGLQSMESQRVRHDLVKQQQMPRMLYEKYLPCKVILCLSEIQRHLYFYLLNLTTCAQEQGSPGFACQLCSWLWCWLHFWGLCSRLHAGWSGLGSDQSAGGREKAKCFWTIFGSGRLSSRVPASARRPAVDLELHRRVSCSFHRRLSVSLRLCITKVTHWAQEACPLPFSVMFLWFIRVVVCMRNSFLLSFFQLYWDIIGIQYCVSLRYTIDRFDAFASDYHHK